MDTHKRVLVVDDDALIREMLATALRAHGLTVDEAADGKEALELMVVAPYAVILLDLLMPNIDGFTLLDALELQEVQPVVIVVTGAERPAVEQLSGRAVHGIVRKPFDPIELANVVAACADIRGRNAFGAMAIAAMMAGSPLLALLNRSWQ